MLPTPDKRCQHSNQNAHKGDPMSSIPSGGMSSGAQAQLDQINANKEKKVVEEAAKTAEQELTTAKAGRVKSLRFA